MLRPFRMSVGEWPGSDLNRVEMDRSITAGNTEGTEDYPEITEGPQEPNSFVSIQASLSGELVEGQSELPEISYPRNMLTASSEMISWHEPSVNFV